METVPQNHFCRLAKKTTKKLISMSTPVKLSHFLFQANVLATSIGLAPFEEHTRHQKYLKFLNIVFIVQLINMNFVIIIEFLFILMAIVRRENFEEATLNLAYFGFTFMSNIKILSVLRKKSLLNRVMTGLRDIYPGDVKRQKDFATRHYAFKFNIISFCFIILHEILIFWYNFYPAARYWLDPGTVSKALPYYVWVPWKWQGHWSYYVLYVSLALAGHTAVSAQLTADLWLCAVVTQITMHYRYLARRIDAYEPCKIYESDKQFLKDCIHYHQHVLSFSGHVNEIFGVSLLVHFISSSFVMCFLSFQVTIGGQTETLIMLIMFLCAALLEVSMICFYGEQLILKSESIGHAAYNQNWLKTDVRYRKLLILMIARSQKPAVLRATQFLKVSLETMTELMQLSYKFYAVIRTMYSK